jgi:hypothetical protein
LLVANKSIAEVVKVSCQNCGTEQAEDSQFCRKCGVSLAPAPATSATSETPPPTAESNQQNSAEVPQPCLLAAVSDEKSNSSINFGAIVFASFSVLSLVVCLAKGIVPIYLAEACVWAAAAIYWHQKGIASPKANLIVLLLAVCVAAGEGYSLGKSGSPNYTYLKEGNVQFRVDSHRGRTDRLFGRGWIPVSFDRPAEAIPSDQIPRIILSNAFWNAGEICLDVQNGSDYVVKGVTIHPAVLAPTQTLPVPVSAVVLQAAYLIDKGDHAILCGTTSFHLLTSDNWSYSDTSASGWRQ